MLQCYQGKVGSFRASWHTVPGLVCTPRNNSQPSITWGLVKLTRHYTPRQPISLKLQWRSVSAVSWEKGGSMLTQSRSIITALPLLIEYRALKAGRHLQFHRPLDLHSVHHHWWCCCTKTDSYSCTALLRRGSLAAHCCFLCQSTMGRAEPAR